MNYLSTSKKSSAVVFWFLLCLFLGGFYYLNHIYPVCYTDDFGNMYVFKKAAGSISWTSERVMSLNSLIRSQYAYYCSWGGRVVAGTLMQTLLMFDKCIFNVINTICYGLGVMCVCILSCRRVDKRSYLLILMTFWLLLPVPGSTVFWISGSISYSWMAFLACAFLCCLMSSNRRTQSIGLLIAFFVGNSHEGLGSGLLIALVIYAILDRKNERGKLFYYSIALLFLGFLSNIMAPGTFGRMGISSLNETNLNVRIGYLYLSFSNLLHTMSVEMIICFSITILSIILNLIKPPLNRTNRLLSISLLIGAVSSELVMFIASHSLYPRACYPHAFLAYLSIALILLPLIQKLPKCLFATMIYILVLANFIEGRSARIQIQSLSSEIDWITYSSRKDSLILLPPNKLCNGGRYVELFGKCPDMFHSYSRAISQHLGRADISIFTKPEEIEILGNERTFSSLEVGKFTDIEGYLILLLPSRPEKVEAEYLYSNSSKRFTGLRGLIINAALKARDTDLRLSCSTFSHKEKYYVFLPNPTRPAIVRVMYENGKFINYKIETSSNESTCLPPKQPNGQIGTRSTSFASSQAEEGEMMEGSFPEKKLAEVGVVW